MTMVPRASWRARQLMVVLRRLASKVDGVPRELEMETPILPRLLKCFS